MIKKIQRYVRRNNGFFPALSNLGGQISKFGLISIMSRITGNGSEMKTDYQYWIDNIETKYNKDEVEEKIRKFSHTPKISVLLPVYNVEEPYLRACIDSVRDQYYSNWELCIADDASTDANVRRILEEYEELDSRIKVVYRKKNGHISEATNSALDIVNGDYIALLDNDDYLKPEALYEVAHLLNEFPLTDMIYTDENKVDATGENRIWPAFKPDWSPDAFLSQMYIGHLGVYRTSIAREIGGFRNEFVGSQDYDFALRISEKAKLIKHIPKILYHWRMIPGSTASGAENKDYAFDASFRAKKEALKRRKISATIVPFIDQHSTILEYHPDKSIQTTVVLSCSEHQVDALKKTVELLSISEVNKILLVSSEKLWNEQFETLVKVFSEIHYHGTQIEYEQLVERESQNEFLFLQCGYLPQENNWYSILSGQAQQSHCGVIGTKLVSSKGYIESAGVCVMFKEKTARNAYFGFHENDANLIDRLLFSFNCLAFEEKFAFVSGEKLAEAIEYLKSSKQITIDFLNICLALDALNYYNVYRGDVCVKSIIKKKSTPIVQTSKTFFRDWKDNYENDPYYNQNFSQKKADYTLNID